MRKLYAPNKKEIVGVLATVPGIMEIRDLGVNEYGGIDAVHMNVFSELWMEEYEYVVEEGRGFNGESSLIYRDEEGNEWLETDLVFEDGTPFPGEVTDG